MVDLRSRIKNDFRFHPANDKTGPMHDAVRAKLYETADFLLDMIPEGRELSLALTHLEEAMMWSNAAIARSSDV